MCNNYFLKKTTFIFLIFYFIDMFFCLCFCFLLVIGGVNKLLVLRECWEVECQVTLTHWSLTYESQTQEQIFNPYSLISLICIKEVMPYRVVVKWSESVDVNHLAQSRQPCGYTIIFKCHRARWFWINGRKNNSYPEK